MQQDPGTINIAHNMPFSKHFQIDTPWDHLNLPLISMPNSVEMRLEREPIQKLKERTSSTEVCKPKAPKYCFPMEYKVPLLIIRSLEMGLPSEFKVAWLDNPCHRLLKLCSLCRFIHSKPWWWRWPQEGQRWTIFVHFWVDRWILEISGKERVRSHADKRILICTHKYWIHFSFIRWVKIKLN